MNSRDMQRIQSVVAAFRSDPCPDTAENLLLVLSKHRQGNPGIQRIVDTVLEYRFLVGSITSSKEVRPLDNNVLYNQPLGVT